MSIENVWKWAHSISVSCAYFRDTISKRSIDAVKLEGNQVNFEFQDAVSW